MKTFRFNFLIIPTIMLALIGLTFIAQADEVATGKGPHRHGRDDFEGILNAVDLGTMTITVSGQTFTLSDDAFVKVEQSGPDVFEDVASLINYLGSKVEVDLDGQGMVVKIEVDAEDDDEFKGAGSEFDGTLIDVNLGTMTINVSGQIYMLNDSAFIKVEQPGPDLFASLENLPNYLGRLVEIKVDADGNVCRIELKIEIK